LAINLNNSFVHKGLTDSQTESKTLLLNDNQDDKTTFDGTFTPLDSPRKNVNKKINYSHNTLGNIDVIQEDKNQLPVLSLHNLPRNTVLSSRKPSPNKPSLNKGTNRLNDIPKDNKR